MKNLKCIYLLRSSKDNELYIGSTTDLVRRLGQHERGEVKSTKHRRPVRLLGFQQFDDIRTAAEHEKKYKRSHGFLERAIKNGKFTVTGNDQKSSISE